MPGRRFGGMSSLGDGPNSPPMSGGG